MIEIDRHIFGFLNGSDSLVLDTIMLDITTWWVWIPMYLALIMLVLKNNETFQRMIFTIGIAFLCFALTEIITDVIAKPMFERLRPCNDPTISAQLVKGYAPKGFSFFSAHAANICGIVTYLCLLFRSRSLNILLIVWAFISCYSRVYLGAHFPGDVIVGAAVGVLVGFLCYRLLRIFETQVSTSSHFVSRRLTSTGFAVIDIDEVICIIFLTFIGIVLHTVIACSF
ncbi:MAG: phosphatase PAP2 family protein [Prevotellaceae bacterium]|nr:phosphatase PAP2 family protein [Prevotellaceae bacterium]